VVLACIPNSISHLVYLGWLVWTPRQHAVLVRGRQAYRWLAKEEVTNRITEVVELSPHLQPPLSNRRQVRKLTMRMFTAVPTQRSIQRL
jgi:hypothetical protein